MTTTPLDAVAESVRVSVHKRAQAVLANGGDTNPELQGVAETVKQLAKVGPIPECFQPEQKRQLIAQINIFQNVRHGKSPSQATVALALEDLKDLLPKLSTLQRADAKGPGSSGEAIKASGRGVKQPVSGGEKQEKQAKKGRERQKAEKPQKRPVGETFFFSILLWRTVLDHGDDACAFDSDFVDSVVSIFCRESYACVHRSPYCTTICSIHLKSALF